MCLPRLGQPRDLASALAFLLSDESSRITGQILSVDGGLMLRE
jgi:NAD(P)-dependent dehydrogenase (short-subunit alcohol dehydrogenase family)